MLARSLFLAIANLSFFAQLGGNILTQNLSHHSITSECVTNFAVHNI